MERQLSHGNSIEFSRRANAVGSVTLSLGKGTGPSKFTIPRTLRNRSWRNTSIKLVTRVFKGSVSWNYLLPCCSTQNNIRTHQIPRSLSSLFSETTVNIYGFERITIGIDIGSYTHHLLVRGKPNICRFMVRTKVKNKGSKAAANSSLSNTSGGASRRSSSAGVRVDMVSAPNIQPLSKMSRSVSCPDATTSRNIKRGIISNASTGINNEIFTLDQSKPQSSNRDLSIRTMPSFIENDFSDDLFSNDPFDVNFSSAAQKSGSNTNGAYVSVSVDSMNDMNFNSMRSSRRNDLPSLLQCKDNIQDDITALGNSSRSNNSQASDVAFQQTELDPFQPQPISEQHMHHQQDRIQQQQIIEQQMQQQQELVREQECRMLQLQIQELQNQIVSMNQQPQLQQQQQQLERMNAPNNHSNYLCNGVAAIEPSDRGMVTPTLSPSQSSMARQGESNHPLEHLAKNPEDLMLDPTPIYTPLMSSSSIDTNMMMSRSISFGSFPQLMISGNVMS